MTSEYDEHVIDFDYVKRLQESLATFQRESAAAIRALTAQVVERDAVIEGVGTWRDSYFVGRDDWNKEIYDLLEQGPHDALAARDAVRDEAVRAEAFDEGWHSCRYGMADPQPPRQVAYANPHRACAAREEL